MQSGTHLEIVCEQAQRFVDPTPERDFELEDVRSAAAELARSMELLPEVRSSRYFARCWRSLRDVLKSLLSDLELQQREHASEDFRWLQENTRLVHTALRDTAELANLRRTPHVRDTSNGGAITRVMAIADGYLANVSYRFDVRTFDAYLEAFQEVQVLDTAEVWALVPCLKLALLQEMAVRGLRMTSHPAGAYRVADPLRSLHHIGETTWEEVLEPRLLIDGILREDPLGAYAAMDFESRSRYRDAVADIAAHCEFSEIDVANAALSLARQAEREANLDHTDPLIARRRSHVGYYLVAEGATVLHQKLGVRWHMRQRLVALMRRHPNAYYLSSIALTTLGLAVTVTTSIMGTQASLGFLLLAGLVFLLPCSQVAIELLNHFTTLFLPAQLLPKLDFEDGIPEACATVVAVPVLLLNEEQVRRLVEDLEVRYLANRDRNLHFALLSDLPDSQDPPSDDDPRVALCAELISKLNEKYAGQKRGAFFLLHRANVFNRHEGVWMGWERKRGKVMDLAKLLRGEFDAFPVKTGDLSLLRNVRFIITLDADTELPRGAACRMVGTMAHPLNRPIVDRARNLVVCGYGIVQPRLGVSIQSAGRSRLSKIYSGETGLDIYTHAVSDVYQDLYGEAIFAGKGICDVDVLLDVLNHRFPDNALLSHDLIEGVYARTGLVSDVELIDDFPSHFSAYSRRKHRWTRGDWQISQWLLDRAPDSNWERAANPLSLASRWKIFDNLRRSLVDVAALLALVLGWTVLPGSAWKWTAAVILLLIAPASVQFVSACVRAAWKRNTGPVRGSGAALSAGIVTALLRLTFLAHQALLSLDAIVRVLVRKHITHRGLLEWETAAEAELRHRRSVADRWLDWLPAVALAIALSLLALRPSAIMAAAPVLVLWAANKLVTHWLNQPAHAAPYTLSTSDRLFLRQIALRTWRYFAESSNEQHHWLIPDNVQEEPRRVAARTSPTDLGLLLNARQAASEFGYLTVPEFAELTSRTLDTIERLPKDHGHLFNWYDTRTLAALEPRFVSSADSGNLAAALWCVQQGCLEWLQRPLLRPDLLNGVIDPLLAMGGAGPSTRIARALAQRDTMPRHWLQSMREWANAPAPATSSDNSDPNLQWFAEQRRERWSQVEHTIALYCPWLSPEFAALCDDPAFEAGERTSLGELPEFLEAAAERVAMLTRSAASDQRLSYRRLQVQLEEAAANSARLVEQMRDIAARAGKLVAQMDFRFLFNRWRKLMSVGFDVDAQRLHPACYDLLASEARLATFIAIAKEDIPQEAWFLLGRTHELDAGRPVLLSWTGTMFEYLMPSLWMRTYPNTLLQRAQTETVRSQQAHAAHHRVPWGISESAYAKRDAIGQYQYRAFGVPALALHKDDDNDAMVISPYSTLLALGVDARAAMRNLRRMAKEGWLASCGFYEAADYTSSPRSFRRRCELVRCWMAHHQGMGVLAIANLLHDGAAQRWFHKHPRVQATELLLQEKPVSAAIRRSPVERRTAAA